MITKGAGDPIPTPYPYSGVFFMLEKCEKPVNFTADGERLEILETI